MEHFNKDYLNLFNMFIDKCARLGQAIQTQAISEEGGSERSCSTQPEPSTQCSTSKAKPYIFEFTTIVQFFEETNFGNIFYCYRSDNSKRQFYDEVNQYLLSHFGVDTNFQDKVFAFYMLCLLWSFQMQNLNLSLKIRMDQHSHGMISNFIAESTDKMLYDVVVMYRELVRAQAFLYVENPVEMGLYYKDYLSKNGNRAPMSHNTHDQAPSNQLDDHLERNLQAYLACLNSIDPNNAEQSQQLCSSIDLLRQLNLS